jgi:hypothetical protein
MVAVGKLPTSPMMVVGPVLVIPEPARTPKSNACPRLTGASVAASQNSARVKAERIRKQDMKTGYFSCGF